MRLLFIVLSTSNNDNDETSFLNDIRWEEVVFLRNRDFDREGGFEGELSLRKRTINNINMFHAIKQ